MGEHALLDRYETWLLASDRSGTTITLRMRHARDLASRMDVLTATVDDVEALMAKRRHLAAETRKSQLASWRVLFGWAHRRGLRPDDPTIDIGSIRVPTRLPKVAPDAAVEGALAGASTRDRALVLLARYGLLRLEELTSLPLSARDGDALRFIGKGNKERTIKANQPLLFALHAQEREVLSLDPRERFYFPGAVDGHLHKMSVNKIITRVVGWNPHSLRHAGATAAYRATGDIRAVQAMLGHASLATTQRYLHLDDESMRRVAEATAIKPARLGLVAA
ncbi:tyrosine-type recombinase/integrase [Microbacterium dauci]|uniref:Tyrosine-type recombinase/integrase n=1 Tax=Microbacterium dauci TaxID=3048008 RepID=A0ABT6ZGS9_9MICO|nr:tyrosine-type recombinase/integrase [Microbacterium sp. LX3-4]MDJ1115355.1 tyrosine-type recombinase/integrase [Microbacterium sp. LX3-4]